MVYEGASSFRGLKQFIVECIYVPSDTVHIYIGVFVMLATAAWYRNRLDSYWILFPGFILSLLLEVPDLWVQGIESERLLLGSSFRDVVHTNFIPFSIVLFLNLRTSRNQENIAVE